MKLYLISNRILRSQKNNYVENTAKGNHGSKKEEHKCDPGKIATECSNGVYRKN